MGWRTPQDFQTVHFTSFFPWVTSIKYVKTKKKHAQAILRVQKSLFLLVKYAHSLRLYYSRRGHFVSSLKCTSSNGTKLSFQWGIYIIFTDPKSMGYFSLWKKKWHPFLIINLWEKNFFLCAHVKYAESFKYFHIYSLPKTYSCLCVIKGCAINVGKLGWGSLRKTSLGASDQPEYLRQIAA